MKGSPWFRSFGGMKKSNVLAVAILVASACKCQPIARPMCDSLVIQDLAAHFEDRGQFREDVGFLALALGGLGVFNVTREARIDKTIHFIEHLDATKLDGSETRAIHLKVGGKELHFVGSQYLMGWAWPNFHFHMTTAYCILRHNGVPLGKADFLGEV